MTRIKATCKNCQPLIVSPRWQMHPFCPVIRPLCVVEGVLLVEPNYAFKYTLNGLDLVRLPYIWGNEGSRAEMQHASRVIDD